MFYNIRKERQLSREEDDVDFDRYLFRQQKIAKSNTDIMVQNDLTKDVIQGRESTSGSVDKQ